MYNYSLIRFAGRIPMNISQGADVLSGFVMRSEFRMKGTAEEKTGWITSRGSPLPAPLSGNANPCVPKFRNYCTSPAGYFTSRNVELFQNSPPRLPLPHRSFVMFLELALLSIEQMSIGDPMVSVPSVPNYIGMGSICDFLAHQHLSDISPFQSRLHYWRVSSWTFCHK